MIKKIAFSLIALLSIITASAQSGSWKIHPVFGATPTNAIDVGDRIYYLVSNNLFCYDKETSENIMYDKSNYLNDTQISNVYYNYDKKYLVVAYSNSDIDIILENGRVKNIPDITNSLMPSMKTINHVTFSGNRIYVATAFGYVVIDDERFEIAESRIYNTSITSATVCGNYLLLSSANGTYIGLASKAHSTLDSFVLYANEKKCKFLPITDKRFLTYGTNAIIYDIATDADGNPTGLTWVKTIGDTAPSSVQPVKSLGATMVLYPATPQYFTIDAEGVASAAVALPTAVKSELLTSQETATGSWWAVGSNGIHKVNIDGTTATTEIDYQKINATKVSSVFYLVYNQEKDYLLAANTGKTVFWMNNGGNAVIDCYKEGTWTPFNPTITPGGVTSATVLYQTYCPLIDPKDSNAFVISSFNQGVFRFVNFEEANHWVPSNSPLYSTGSDCNAHAVDLDSNGNIWMISGIQSQSPTPAYILTRDKFDVETPSASDWITANISLDTSWGNMFYIARKSDVKIFCNGGWGNLTFFKEITPGDYSNIKQAKYLQSSAVDQDGNKLGWTYIYCFCEDLSGNVWMGHAKGLCIWTPEEALNGNSYAIRPKVPRNDGTNNADYLLNGVRVNCIAVDDLNRKWIGTESNGVFLVSPDGTEIIEQLNTSNSVLPTDQILSICCKPNSNTVYIGTANGVLEYETSSVTPAPTYDDVLVYPNPVRPEYTGVITIKGLMANSLVKISDASGNVITSLQATAGTAIWDGLNASGERVKSGVYYVLASENEDETSSAIVAKFLVIR